MASLATRAFGVIAAGAAALMPAPAISETVPANQNVTAAAVTPTVQFINAQDRTMNDARGIAASASYNRVAIIVWGGNRALQQEAYNAARDLNNIGIETAFVLAPDHNSLPGDAVMQVYAASKPRFDAHGGSDNARDVRPMMRNAGVDAYREAFPRRVAALQLGS